MMRDRITDQIHMQLLRDLFHDRGFADAGRSHQQNGALLFARDQQISRIVRCEIGAHGVVYFFFCFCNGHGMYSDSIFFR